MKHAHIYSSTPMAASLLGWILQQSDSYKSNFFVCDDENLEKAHMDPWDNHSAAEDDWSHAYIEDIESDVTRYEFDWLDSFVDSFVVRSIFGLSYGEWKKSIVWHNSKLDTILILSTDRLRELFYESYERRLVDKETFLENIKMHVHDHRQNDESYNEYIMNLIYEDGLKCIENDSLEFWQMQYCFHHKGNGIPDKSSEDTIKQQIMSELTDDTVCYDGIEVDLFNLDLKALCKQLDIVYNDKMEEEYNKFLDYVNNVVQV